MNKGSCIIQGNGAILGKTTGNTVMSRKTQILEGITINGNLNAQKISTKNGLWENLKVDFINGKNV